MITNHISGTLSSTDRLVIAAVPCGGNWRHLPLDFPSRRVDQIRRGAAAGKGSRSTYYGRLSWDRPSYTISTFFNRPGNGCFIHPEAPRLLTVREAARLQTFPDWFHFTGSGRAPYVQVGNAVPPLLAYQLGRVLGPGLSVDLFCGAGGLSLGLKMAGHTVIAAIDNEPSAIATYQLNHGDGDIAFLSDLSDSSQREVAMKEVLRRSGGERIHLLAGGPPCQGFSTAGKCESSDPRNKLVFAFLSSVEVLRPRFVLMENVPALVFRRGRHVLATLRQSLHALGYATSAIVAHAEGYGIPQLRRRLFLLASREDIRWPLPWRGILPPHHLSFQPGAIGSFDGPSPLNVREAIGDLPLMEAPTNGDAIGYSSDPVSELQRWARGELAPEAFIPLANSEDALRLFEFGHDSL